MADNPRTGRSFEHLTQAEAARVVNQVLYETRHARQSGREFAIAPMAAMLGAGIAMILGKAIGLIAATGRYGAEVSERSVTALFIIVIVGVIFLAGTRFSEVRGLAEENDRRLAELDARLNNLRHGKTR